jgi:hypothetical protein
MAWPAHRAAISARSIATNSSREFSVRASMPLALPENLYLAIQRAVAPVTASERPQFLAELADALQAYPVIGEGLLHRLAAELQRKHAVEARATAVSDEHRASARFRRGSDQG